MDLTPSAMVLLGLMLAGWTFGAVFLVIAAQRRSQQARSARSAARRLTRMLDDSPAIPMVVRADGRIEGPERLASWLGLDKLPGYLSEFDAGEAGLEGDELEQLRDAVRRTQKTAAPFRMTLTPRGSQRSLAVSRPIPRLPPTAPRCCGGSTFPKATGNWPGCAPSPLVHATILPLWSA
jgi:hypothetical protein